ncbi:uncharacterized protein LOC116182494 [Photinus pyralis]|uniref:uncharacterized protein LOC116182494 n=1 Tax=Photinus pyralis TaxID=7054 RepID=UPI001266F5AB|nr:uncharacterized protein LOC116182494 [Photinus pyralis]
MDHFRLRIWKEENLNKSLFDVKVLKVPHLEYPNDALFKPLKDYTGNKVVNYKAIRKWFLDRKANKGFDRGRILAMQLFIKYCKMYIDGSGSNIYIQASCCAEQKKSSEYKIKIKITKLQSSHEITQANCSSPAGIGWSAACKHIGALCFSLEHFSVTGNDQEYVSCTSQQMCWNKPSEGRCVDVMSIFDITEQDRNDFIIDQAATDALVNCLINTNINCALINSGK